METNFSFKVIILGCQRTGTTLLKEILNAGQIFMMEENWIWAYLNRERWHACGVWHQDVNVPSPEQSLWDQSVKMFTKIAYEQYYTASKSDRHQYWGVKAPGLNMAKTAQYLEGLFPELQFLIVVRDPRDVFASMKSSPKMLNHLPTDFYNSPTNSPDLVDIYRDPYGYWDKVYSAIEHIQSYAKSKCHVVRYEEMLSTPLPTTEKICDFLGITFSENMLEPFSRKISNASVVSMSSSDYISRNYVVSKSAIGRWEKDLSPGELEKLSFSNGITAVKMGYDILDNHMGLQDKRQVTSTESQTYIDRLSSEKTELKTREKWHLNIIATFLIGESKKIEHRFIKTFANLDSYGWVYRITDLVKIADNAGNPLRSHLLLFEDKKLLCPAHSIHEEIFRLGGGRYSHWNEDLIFSTSDNSDPNTNGRSYQIVFTESAC